MNVGQTASFAYLNSETGPMSSGAAVESHVGCRNLCNTPQVQVRVLNRMHKRKLDKRTEQRVNVRASV